MLLLFKAVEAGGKQIFIFWAFLFTFAQPYWSLNMLSTSPYYNLIISGSQYQCSGQIQFVVLGWLGRILNRCVGLMW
jgi:hypothetical protein